MSSATIMTMFGFFACCASTGGTTANSAATRLAMRVRDGFFMCSPAVPASRRSVGSEPDRFTTLGFMETSNLIKGKGNISRATAVSGLGSP
jgi:hypothetical protein